VGGPYEIGEWDEDQQGRRTDLDKGLELFKEGGVKRIANEDPKLFVKYHRGFQALEGFLSGPVQRTKERECFIIIGDAGCGKTRWAFDNFKCDLYVSPIGQNKNSLWFDGYRGQMAALLDDFRGSTTFEDLLKICDPWYNHRVPVKGSYVIWEPDIVVITSNEGIDAWYANLTPEQIKPLRRRIRQYLLPADKDLLSVDLAMYTLGCPELMIAKKE